jgi:hypothetical protein
MIVPSAIHALFRATLLGSVIKLARRQGGMRWPVAWPTESPDESHRDEGDRNPDGDPQCGAHAAGADVEICGRSELLSVGC